MKTLLLIFFTFFISYSFAQYSDHFKKIVKGLKIKKSYTDTLFFASEKIKSIKTYSIYDFNNEEYHVQTGKSIEKYRNGKIKFEEWFDNFGNPLTGKYFNKKGNLLTEMIETEINTNAKNLKLFINSLSGIGHYPNDTMSYKRLIKQYAYSKKHQKWYIYQEDYLTFINNVKKERVRNFLNLNGELTNTKNKKF